jgi:sugar-specific transcriptional regulator TrmB
MIDAHQLLTRFGLTESEIRVYLASLPYGSVSANQLTKETKLKRPTVYHALLRLGQRGLVSKKISGNRTLFNVTPPEQLKGLLAQQIAQLEEQKSSLDELIGALNKSRIGARMQPVQVSQFEGTEGIKLVVEDALYCRSGRWDIIAPRKNFFSESDKEYARYYLATRKRRGILARTLWERESGSAAKSQRALTADEVTRRQPRYLPQVMNGKFKSVIIIYDNKVAIISSYKSLFAILIESDEVNATTKAMFEGLWALSQPYAKK